MLTQRAKYRMLEEVNREVNRSTKYKTDMELYSRQDFWTIANGEGDCEDYALKKRQLLIERGFPVEDLRLTVVKDENGEGHAILTADVGKVTVCLDNRFNYLLGPDQLVALGYEFLWRQAKGGGSKWARVAR